MESTATLAGANWVNSSPINIETLASDALFVFFAAGCELSHARLRQIKHLKNSYNSNVPVILVHSPRFDYEDSVNTVLQALQMLQIDYPTLHDPTGENWEQFGAAQVPTVCLRSSDGTITHGPNGTLEAATFHELFTAGKDSDDPETAEIHAEPAGVATKLNTPTRLALGPDNLLAISDPGAGVVLLTKVDEDERGCQIEGYIDELLRPGDVLFTVAGTLCVSDADRGTVHEYDLTTGKSRILAKDLKAPKALAVDRDGSVLISDSAANIIYRIPVGSQSSERFQKVAGTGVFGCTDNPSQEAELAQPNGMIRTEFGLYFCESGSSKIRMLTEAGNVLTKNGKANFSWGWSDGSGRDALMQRPTDVAVDSRSALIISDTGNSRLRQLFNGKLTTVGVDGFNRPEGVEISANGSIFVADTGNSRVAVVNSEFTAAHELICR